MAWGEAPISEYSYDWLSVHPCVAPNGWFMEIAVA